MDAIQNSTILMWGVTLLIFLIRMGARLAGKSFRILIESSRILVESSRI
jgi:hypothetical protein